MTDDLDATLRDRFARLSAAVPVYEPPVVARVRAGSVVRGSTSRRLRLGGAVPVLALVVAGVLIAGIAGIAQLAPGATDQPAVTAVPDAQPISATVIDGLFDLTIRASKNRYAVGEPIAIDAVLTYRGPGAVTIFHAQGAPVRGRGNVDGPDTGGAGGPIGFGIVEPVLGDLRLNANWAESCERTVLVPGQPLIVPFAKDGSWPSDSPQSDEFRAFLLVPDLRLAAGEWHAFAVARFAIDDCAGELREPRVQLEFEVSPDAVIPTVDPAVPTPNIAPPTPSIAPQPSAVVDTDSDGPYAIELRSERRVYRESEAIEGTATLIYSGDAPIEIWGIGLFFSVEEPVYGMSIGDILTAACGRTVLEPGEPLGGPFHKGGGVSSADPLRGFHLAYLNDPVFRLPPGTWHLHYGGSLYEGPCGQDTPTRTFSTTIAIVVLPEDGAEVLIATASGPNTNGLCDMALASGTLAANPRSGLGFENGGSVKDIIWPFGFSARRDGDRIVLVNAAGQDVAKTGDQMAVGGGSVGENTFSACLN